MFVIRVKATVYMTANGLEQSLSLDTVVTVIGDIS